MCGRLWRDASRGTEGGSLRPADLGRPANFCRSRAIGKAPGTARACRGTRGRNRRDHSETRCADSGQGLRSEADHQPRRKPQMVLRGAEKPRVQLIALQTPGDSRNQLVIEPPAYRGGNRCVGVRIPTPAVIRVARTHQEMGKGRELADRNRYSRPHQKSVGFDIYFETAATVNRACLQVLGPVTAVEVRDNANPGQKLPFERSFPTV